MLINENKNVREMPREVEGEDGEVKTVTETSTDFDYDGVWIDNVLSEQDVPSKVREYVVGLINGYDTSSKVNTFVLSNGTVKVNYWLSAAKRNQLVRSVTSWKDAGNKNYTLDLREYGVSVDIPCDTLLTMLDSLENYAVACYNATSKHINAVSQLTDIEELLEYDYTQDYPDVLTFEV